MKTAAARQISKRVKLAAPSKSVTHQVRAIYIFYLTDRVSLNKSFEILKRHLCLHIDLNSVGYNHFCLRCCALQMLIHYKNICTISVCIAHIRPLWCQLKSK